MPKEISDFTSWLHTSEPTQRVQLLNYLRSLTTVLEENELETYLNPSSLGKATNRTTTTRKQPTLSYLSQARIKSQRNGSRKASEFAESINGEAIDVHKLFPQH